MKKPIVHLTKLLKDPEILDRELLDGAVTIDRKTLLVSRALRHGKLDVAKTVLDDMVAKHESPRFGEQQVSWAFVAVFSKQVDVANFLLSYAKHSCLCIHFRERGDHLLHVAVNSGSLKMTEFLLNLSNPPDPKSENMLVFNLAIELGHASIFRLLLEKSKLSKNDLKVHPLQKSFYKNTSPAFFDFVQDISFFKKACADSHVVLADTLQEANLPLFGHLLKTPNAVAALLDNFTGFLAYASGLPTNNRLDFMELILSLVDKVSEQTKENPNFQKYIDVTIRQLVRTRSSEKAEQKGVVAQKIFSLFNDSNLTDVNSLLGSSLKDCDIPLYFPLLSPAKQLYYACEAQKNPKTLLHPLLSARLLRDALPDQETPTTRLIKLL